MTSQDRRELLEVETIHGGRADGDRFFLHVGARPDGVLHVLEQRFRSPGVGREQALRAAVDRVSDRARCESRIKAPTWPRENGKS